MARSGIAAAAVAVLVLAAFAVARSGTPDKQFQARYDASTRQLSVSLPTFSGGTLSSAALAGKPTVLNFYASWCGVCHREMPDFQAVHIALGQRVNFVGVHPQSNDSDSSQAEMVARTGVPYPTVRDHNDDLLRLFEHQRVPGRAGAGLVVPSATGAPGRRRDRRRPVPGRAVVTRDELAAGHLRRTTGTRRRDGRRVRPARRLAA